MTVKYVNKEIIGHIVQDKRTITSLSLTYEISTVFKFIYEMK